MITVTEEIPTKGDFADLRREFGDLGRQFADLKRDFTDLKGSVNLLGWMTGINITLTLLVLGKLLLTGHP